MVSHPTHRIRVKGDGRCCVRAALTAAAEPPPSVDPATDATLEARSYLRDMRIAATRALVDRMNADEDVDCAVRWSFPDEHYDTFDEWIQAQSTDDTEDHTSDLWRGGGQWMLYGLALLLRAQIFVHSVDSATLTFRSPPQGTELVDARPKAEQQDGEETPGGPTIHLAAMQNDLGEYDHFDVLLFDDRRTNAEPMVRPPIMALARRPPTSAAHRKNARLLAWAAFNVLAVALAMSIPPASTVGGNGVPPQGEWLAHVAHVAHMLTQQLSTHAAQLIYLGAGAGGSPLAAHAHMSAMPTATSIALPTLPEVVIAPEVAVTG